MKGELLYGLKNALERGSTLEQAVNSFISAGYNPFEVKAAARELTEGTAESAISIMSEKPKNEPLPNMPENFKQPDKMGGKKLALIIFLIVAGLGFLGAVGFLVYLLIT
jgi:hypothetical protein